ncbi:MAG: DUF4062 domain-containing protein [candidate division Zixibacteria bacterium]|nr:DUF4062 domain-containing protein [candidate division Zixibacteria bacterium]MBU1469838.1 DUF4062 domain-containing protein [candidate division Zixibacteria bacterium]MBU2626643.1 DUF4062 domain-containing protein [candidate division Zixibacteria bacterium]
MDKRFQVFVSSTYEDLKVERQKVIQSLLEIDCIPVGMEFFPAADDAAWEVIRKVIEESDYYVVIVGGRYGSLTSRGISYTQREYEYAVERGVPVAAFLHAEPDSIPSGKTEMLPEGREKLEEFRGLCRKRMCKSWKTDDELAAAVVKSFIYLKRNNPAIGWVRADQMPDEFAAKEILRLQSRVRELENEREMLSTKPPAGTESLQQSDDDISILIHVRAKKYWGPSPENYEYMETEVAITRTWNDLLKILSPAMIGEASENDLKQLIDGDVGEREIEMATSSQLGIRLDIDSWHISIASFHIIIIQLRSLGIIVQGDKPRSLKDGNTYWKLTSYGDNVMTRMLALRRVE